MKIEEIRQYIDQGNEIEFIFNNKKYSITYGEINGREVISFCEFNKESSEVESFDELLNIKRDNTTVKEMIESCTLNDMWIY